MLVVCTAPVMAAVMMNLLDAIVISSRAGRHVAAGPRVIQI